MNDTSTSSPFAPLNLTREAELELRDLAAFFLDEALTRYQEYLSRDHRALDPTRWKFLKQHDDVRVYCERGSAASARRRESLQVTASPLSQRRSDPWDLPVLLTVGTLPGELYDVMYGVMSPTDDAFQVKSSYVDNTLAKTAVLATIEQPTLDDPFRSVTVKWAVKDLPLHVRSMVKIRDLVLLDSTGLAHLPGTGELVGYQLLHSVHFPETHDLPGTVRGKASIVTLYRQHQDNVVEVYAHGCLDPTGKVLRTFSTKAAADFMISVGRSVHCSNMKKLAYALECKRQSKAMSMSICSTAALRPRSKSSQGHGDSTTKYCAVCAKRLSTLNWGRRHGGGVECALCLTSVCTSCHVKKELSSIAETGRLERHSETFCVLCVVAVTQSNALEIARDEVTIKKADRARFRSSVTSSASCESLTLSPLAVKAT